MDSPRVIESSQSDCARVVQLTDCHVFADAGSSMRGLNTRDSLFAVIELIRQQEAGADLLLATGDLSQDGSAESYRYLAQQLDTLGKPGFWIPGNHDDTAVMSANLNSTNLSPARRILTAGWQIVLLDSTLVGQVHGRVATEQLDFLDAALNEYPAAHALVCLHHQAMEIGSRWIDQKGLLEAEILRQRIGAQRQVRGVLWGHVHQEFHLQRDGIDWMSTPSTCIQFKPGADEFTLDSMAPGYRSLLLHDDGRIESTVHRVAGFDFENDPADRDY